MRRRDLNPGDVFVYLENPRNHPQIKVGELRYVVGAPWQAEAGESVGAEPSPRGGRWLHQLTLDAQVARIVVIAR